jgi:hypothetical protein
MDAPSPAKPVLLPTRQNGIEQLWLGLAHPGDERRASPHRNLIYPVDHLVRIYPGDALHGGRSRRGQSEGSDLRINTHDTRRIRLTIAAAAVAAMAVLAAGCSGDSQEATPTTQTSPTTEAAPTTEATTTQPAPTTGTAPNPQAGNPCGPWGTGKKVRLEIARLFVEYNATDDDIGVHGGFDSAGWSRLCVYDPTGRPVLAINPKSQLRGLTIGGIFFESREPTISEFSFDDLKARFPEGRYKVRGLTFDGNRLVGQALFTHDIPREPEVNAPRDGAEVARNGLTVRWNDVTRTIDGDPLTIAGYEVIITKLQREDRHAFSLPIYDVHLPPDRNSLPVPSQFLEPGSKYELEVLALEKSGNQTISVRFFTAK